MEFKELKDMDLREAWPNEAHDFTPWLAENLERLSRVIGIPLEAEGTEVAVEGFAADILARNPMDGTSVLIENQLEGTDHTHLGQVLTYLAGLEVADRHLGGAGISRSAPVGYSLAERAHGGALRVFRSTGAGCAYRR